MAATSSNMNNLHKTTSHSSSSRSETSRSASPATSGNTSTTTTCTATIQSDQIPMSPPNMHSHTSASYKQELMDSSVLLDNINELLTLWDTHQQNHHSLQPFNFAAAFGPLTPPLSSVSTSVSTSTSPPSTHNKRSKRSKYLPIAHSSKTRRNKPNKTLNKNVTVVVQDNSNYANNKSDAKSTPAAMMKSRSGGGSAGGLTMAVPHQMLYIKDDTSIAPKKKNDTTGMPSKATRSSSKHRQHQRLHHNINISARIPIHITSIDDVPSFVQRNQRRLSLLKEMVELKRLELERVSSRHEHTLSAIISLYLSAGHNIVSLRKQHRTLSMFAEQLSRQGAMRNQLRDSILNTLHNVEEQRKNLLNVIESPSWEIKHHFHILSFEHFRGNQQPHLLEIAEVLPSRLQIAAISHHSVQLNDELLRQFHAAEKERDLLFKKLSQIDKKRNLTQAHLKDYKKMMTIIKKNITEKRLNEKLKLKQQDLHLQQQQSPMFHGHSMPTPFRRNLSSSPMMITSPPSASTSPAMMGMGIGASPDRFRLQYLSGIGIRKKKKVEFNLIDFVMQINKFLGVSNEESRAEIAELKNDSDLVNPITGQSKTSAAAAAAIASASANGENKDGEKKEKESDKSNDGEVEKPQQKEKGKEKDKKDKKEDKKKAKLKPKIKHRLTMKEKRVRANVLKIVDREKFVLHEEKQDSNSFKNPKTMYKVSLTREHHHRDDVSTANTNVPDRDREQKGQSDEKDVAHLELLDTVHVKETDKDGSVDAPHRDWSVLAKYLKDSSKEQARRKQILKQLERILHVREGLDVGLEQLQGIYHQQQTSKIEPK